MARQIDDIEKLYELDSDVIRVDGLQDPNLSINLDRTERWLDRIMNTDSFQQAVFYDVAPLFNLKQQRLDPSLRKSREKVVSIITDCAIELMIKVILDICGGRFNPRLLKTIAIACVAISIKLIGAYDWIRDENVIRQLVLECRRLQIPGMRTCSEQKVFQLEADILSRTDWKACHNVAGLEKVYDKRFPEEESLKSISKEEMEEMLQQSQRYRKSLPRHKLELIFDKIWYLRSDDGSVFSADDIAERGIKKANVSVASSIVKKIARGKNLSMEGALEWLKSRILHNLFELNEYTLSIKDNAYSGKRSRSKRRSRSRRSRKSF